MSRCESSPTQTLFGSLTTQFHSVSTSFTTIISTAPDITSTFLSTSTSCTSVGASPFGAFTTASCQVFTVTSSSVIPGATTTLVDPIPFTLTFTQITAFPTSTLYGISCVTTQIATTDTTASHPNSSSSPALSPIGSSTTSTGSLATSSFSTLFGVSGSLTYLLSVPPPSVYTTTTAVAIGSSTIISVITTSSTPPASTIFSDSSGFKTRRDSEGLIGGVIGGVLAVCILLGIVILSRRRKKKAKEPHDDAFGHTKGPSSRLSRPGLECEFDDDEVIRAAVSQRHSLPHLASVLSLNHPFCSDFSQNDQGSRVSHGPYTSEFDNMDYFLASPYSTHDYSSSYQNVSPLSTPLISYPPSTPTDPNPSLHHHAASVPLLQTHITLSPDVPTVLPSPAHESVSSGLHHRRRSSLAPMIPARSPTEGDSSSHSMLDESIRRRRETSLSSIDIGGHSSARDTLQSSSRLMIINLSEGERLEDYS
ncbi:uncharacterized protein EI90DRAFT_3155071 [Cantharellus anzutake]|uniref:uncharacterized protein n=1 Tax=Cantharellus anzutake TaxID=1750568 RepID=UPI001903FFD8|nr:uncharacterized protein EI90DRAFT_3155071 [Cantharellus anzutake]KAF8329974.1 hypothetical protein EI90DRAFT_3155071 [Cantharellus anzutake]